MPAFNEWIRAERFEDVEVELVTRPDVDVVWNQDFSMFKLIRLSWWDDASYARYQSDCGLDY